MRDQVQFGALMGVNWLRRICEAHIAFRGWSEASLKSDQKLTGEDNIRFLPGYFASQTANQALAQAA